MHLRIEEGKAVASAVKRGLGWYSKFVYPILVLIFIYVFLHYEFMRIDLGNVSLSREKFVEQFTGIRNEFLLYILVLLVVGVVWSRFVKRDQKRHPERYKRYA
jgi:hypothetical protein